jgi:Trk K+ transport system NAD-binding subunit
MNRVIVYGLSHLGFKIAVRLKHSGTDVLVAAPQGSSLIPQLERLQVPVIAGDLQDFDLFTLLGLEQAQSLILPSEDDLFNLKMALYAIEANPKLRVVVRLFNDTLGEKLKASIKNFTVLSVSQLASSSFATAALLEHPVLAFESGEDILNIQITTGAVLSGKSIAEAEQDHPLKVLSVNDDVFPRADRGISAEDRLLLFSRFAQAYELGGIRTQRGGSGGKKRAVRGRRSVPDSIRRMDPLLMRTIAALIVVAVSSVLYFHYADRLGFLDAGYFVVTILTTTGFGDINLKDSVALSKAVGMGLMLSGMALMAMMFAIISDSLLKKRLELFLGRRRVKLQGHIVLCGLGDVGIRVLEDLVRLGEQVVVIEKDPEGKFIQSLRQRNVPLIISDATQEEPLFNANIRRAKAIICVTDNDIRNLEIGLNARGQHPNIRVVLRIFEEGFAAKIERHFNIHVALSSSAIAAPAFIAAAQKTGTIGTVSVSGRPMVLRELALQPGSETEGVAGKRMKLLMVKRPDGSLTWSEREGAAGPEDRMICLVEG